MKDVWFRISSAARYLLTARHRKGFGVHSPFVFHTLNEVVFLRENYYCYSEIERLRRMLLNDPTTVSLVGCGTASARTATVGQIARQSGEPARYAQLLFRLALSNKSKTVLEFGTSLGISSLYLSAVSSDTKVFTFEFEKELVSLAKKNFEKLHRYNINIIEGEIDENLPKILDGVEQLDFVFFDANHTCEATLRYFEQCLKKAHKCSIFVFDDIYWSADMNQAWKNIISRPEVGVSMDLYRMGIVWFDPEIPKRNYIVAYH